MFVCVSTAEMFAIWFLTYRTNSVLFFFSFFFLSLHAYFRVSRMTSFGKCLCVRQPDGSFVSVPVCPPMRTGVRKIGGPGWEACVCTGLRSLRYVEVFKWSQWVVWRAEYCARMREGYPLPSPRGFASTHPRHLATLPRRI